MTDQPDFFADSRQLLEAINQIMPYGKYTGRRLLELPGDTRLFLGHDYKAPGRDDYAWETTVAAERANNIHVRDGVTEEEFVAMRTKRDATLAAPTLLLPSLQVNIRAGHLPAPEDNGRRYLKIPLKL